jgi:hypothetical protein
MIYYFLQFDHHSFDFFVLLLKLFFLFNFTFQLKICSCPLIYFNFNFYQHFLIVFFLILDPLMWLLFFFRLHPSVFDLLEVGLCGFFLHGASGLMTHRLILVFLLKKKFSFVVFFDLFSIRLSRSYDLVCGFDKINQLACSLLSRLHVYHTNSGTRAGFLSIFTQFSHSIFN